LMRSEDKDKSESQQLDPLYQVIGHGIAAIVRKREGF
jgi:hypothetical protein